MKHALIRHHCTLPCLMGHVLVPLLLTIWFVLSAGPVSHIHHAFWAAAIPAIISAVGGYLATKQAGKKSSTTKQLEQQQLDASKFLVPFGQKSLTQASDALQTPLGFYSQLAHGDRNALLQNLSPELQSRDASDEAATRSVSELAPRGGASSDFFARMPFRRTTDTANMLFGARRAGNEGLATLGTNLASMGSNAISGGTTGGMNLLNFGLNSNRQAFQQGSDTGQGIFQLVKAFTDAYSKNKTSNPWGVSPASTATTAPSSSGGNYWTGSGVGSP